MTKRRRTLPPVSPKVPAELRPLIAAMSEILETGEGVRGDPLDRKLTLRDVLDSGIGKLKPSAHPGTEGGLQSGAQPPAPDLRTPPPPQGFAAQGSFYGMINVSWQIPSELYRNHAYTNIYRSEEDNFANASIVGRSLGAFHSDFVRNDALDPQDPLHLKGYYYWITFTSAADVEGPPSATAGLFARPLPDLDYVLGLLSDQIDASHLAESLRAPIERIDVLDGAETLEGSVAYRLAEERDARIAALQAERTQTTAQITQEATARDDQFGQIVTMIDDLEAGVDDDYSAGLSIERQARIAGDEALASDITALTAVADQNAADIVSESQARATAVEAVASDVTALYVTTDTLEGEILDEARVRATEDDLLAGVQRVISAAGEIQAASIYTLSEIRINDQEVVIQEISGLQGRLGDAEGAIQSEAAIRLQQDEALAQQITDVQASLGEDFAAVQQELLADVERIDGELVSLGAAYMVKLQANGLVGGFGLYNDGQTVDAAFDVDRFWIGRSDDDKRKPFVIDGGVTYIDEAMIRDASIQEGQIGPLTIGKLEKADGTPVTTAAGLLRADAIDVNNLAVAEAATFSGDLSSDNFVSGSAGWLIRKSGYAEFNEAMFRGNIEVQSITVNGESPIAGATVTIDGFSNSRSLTGGSLGSYSYNIARTGEAFSSKMPQNSVINFDIYLDAISSLSGNLTRSGSYTIDSGGDPTATTASYEYIYRASYTVRARTRVWVDGNLVIDDNQVRSSSQTGGSFNVSRGVEGRTATRTYTYPAYRESSRISVRVDIENVVSVSLHSASPSSASAAPDPNRMPSVTQARSAKNRITSGQISRIG